jgi:hypothetical protein
MAGHTSEKRWRTHQTPLNPIVGVSEQVSELCKGVLSALNESEKAYAELQELYVYAGSTVQGIANQLFFEDWSVRGTPGDKAILTVDVVSGIVTAVDISDAGTAYTDGVSYLLHLTNTAGGGGGTAVISYDVVSGSITNAAVVTGGDSYTDGLAQLVQEMPNTGMVYETEANAEELGKAQDMFDAVTALHELHQAAGNQVVAAEDRYSQLRRMS